MIINGTIILLLLLLQLNHAKKTLQQECIKFFSNSFSQNPNLFYSLLALLDRVKLSFSCCVSLIYQYTSGGVSNTHLTKIPSIDTIIEHSQSSTS